VQGATAAPAIVRALQRLYAQPGLDLVILARGGGSLEDLWPFNDERVVRSVVAAPLPVVVGVGHESDVTLADFAADVRAPTPSAAAELAVPDASQLLAVLGRLRERARTALSTRVADRRRLLTNEGRALTAHAPNLEAARQQAAELVDRGHRALQGRVERELTRLVGMHDALRALGPAATLERGYAVARLASGEIIRSPDQAAVGGEVVVVVAHGSLGTRVERLTIDGGDNLL
jgi:exodeoxyribonuclease VII large subunit